MNQAKLLDLHQISQQALKMKSYEREVFLAKVFSSAKFYGRTQSQKIGSKKFNRGQIIQVEMESGIEERNILGFKGFARSTKLSFEDVDEYSRPTFILGSSNGDVRYWRASQVFSVTPYWSEALLILEQEFFKIHSEFQEWESNLKQSNDSC